MLRCELRMGSKRLPSSSLAAMTWPANVRPHALLQPALPQVTLEVTKRSLLTVTLSHWDTQVEKRTKLPLTQDSRTSVLQKKSKRFSSFSLVFSIFSWEVESVKECLNAWSVWLFSEWTQDMVFFPRSCRSRSFLKNRLGIPMCPRESAETKCTVKWSSTRGKASWRTPSIAQSVCDIPPPLISVHLHELLNAFHGHVVSWSRQFSSAMHPLPCR